MTAFVYGKADPHPIETHPRVLLADHLSVTPAVPVVVDYASQVTSWPVYMNTKIGDCTCAALGHAVQAWTTYGKGFTQTLADQTILSLYEAVSGYNPATGENDHGAVEQDVLKYIQANGIGEGHTIRAFAQVNHQDLTEMKQALDIFGTLYVGFQCPRSAEEQFAASQLWSVVPGSPILGGHAIDIQKWDANYIWAVTWGKLQPMTAEFWLTYGDEAWVIITDDWLNSQGVSPTGLNLDSLIAEFDEIAGITPPPAAPAQKKGCGLFRWFRNLIT